jgi:beta-lactamase regulating signal transducer with metallopeptidase domain
MANYWINKRHNQKWAWQPLRGGTILVAIYDCLGTIPLLRRVYESRVDYSWRYPMWWWVRIYSTVPWSGCEASYFDVTQDANGVDTYP